MVPDHNCTRAALQRIGDCCRYLLQGNRATGTLCEAAGGLARRSHLTSSSIGIEGVTVSSTSPDIKTREGQERLRAKGVRPVPEPDDLTRPYWEAASRSELRIQH